MAALIAVAAVAVLLLILLSAAIRVAREYERGVIFRLGRLKSPPKGPGLFLLIPIIDKMVRVDLRTVTLNVPPQEVITKDNVPVRVNAVAYFRIIDPEKAIVQVENFMVATSQIAQTTLRSVLGQHSLDELLSERDKINAILQQIIDEATSPWGIKVSIVEVKDVEIPDGHAARDGPPGRGRARAAREGDRRRGRVPGLRAAEGRGAGPGREPDVAPAPVPADDARDQLRALVDDHPAAADRALPAADREARSGYGQQQLTARAPAGPDLGPDRRHRAGERASAPAPSEASSSSETPRSSRAARSARAARTARRPRRSRSRRTDREPDTPGWQVRVVPNLYPAFEHQEVVVHSPRHVRSLAELAEDELAPIGIGLAPADREPPAARAFPSPVLVNEGREAGASLPHSHSQLVWLREAPPEAAAELHEPAARGLRALRPARGDESLEIALARRAVASGRTRPAACRTSC